jgi:hypothetical protein
MEHLLARMEGSQEQMKAGHEEMKAMMAACQEVMEAN